jgi:DNA polymerase-3 subunit gamma/tau
MFPSQDLANAFEARGKDAVQQAASQALGHPVQVRAVVVAAQPPVDPDDDIPSPDDPAAGVRALTGVPLVIEMLGGEVVEELTED